MRFRFKQPLPLSSLRPPQSSPSLHSIPKQSSFGIAFDIDGVILRGQRPIANSPKALKRLYDDSGALKFPFLFLTNVLPKTAKQSIDDDGECIFRLFQDPVVLGFQLAYILHGYTCGGFPESKRASELSNLLNVKILPSQVVQGHSPFRTLLNRFENELIVATGKGVPAEVMSEYGFKRVLSLDEYASYFDHIDPVAHYKRWTSTKTSNWPRNSPKSVSCPNVISEKVKAAFVVSDPVDWGRDIQVLCDILTSGGLPGEKHGCQPPLYFAADDMQYQAAFPSERLGMGAFRIALESIFNRIHSKSLEYTCFGKPNPFVFRNAETILKEIQKSSCQRDAIEENAEQGLHSFKTLYMIGDNPLVDVKGAHQAGSPWFSILTRTGVFRQKENHAEYPAHLVVQVVDTVEEAVEFILKREVAS